MAVQKRTTAKGTVRWAVTWNEAGKRREKWFDRRADAIQFDADVKLRKARRLPIIDDRMTVHELAVATWNGHYRLKSQRYQQATRAQLTNHIIPWFGGYRVVDLAPDVIAETMQRMADAGVNPPTLREVHKHLSVMCTKGIQWGHIATNPMSLVDKPPTDDTLIEVYTPDQVHTLADAMGRRNHRDYALTITTAFTGLRISEALALEWRDIRDTTIRIERALDEDRSAKPTKSYQQRTVPALEQVRAVLGEWRQYAPPTDLVFPNERGLPIHESNFNRRNWQPARVAAGLPNARFHELRHTFASHCIEHGVSIVRLSRWMGHRKPSITLDVYGHLYERESDEETRIALSDGLAGHDFGR